MQLLVVLTRGGGRWGLARDAVREVVRQADGLAVATEAGLVRADAVLDVAAHLNVRPPGTFVARFWPGRCLGVAIHDGAPVVVVSPAALPPVLQVE
ncbi:MAG: hypothetical protein B7Z68_00870 [Acidobacteria bacterium 21-70-11]|nr:MAG: hypothetical protein B7Z68_00870 [Acidobacteria bacterium 21-70-11]